MNVIYDLGIDLNLLLIFDAVLEERNVTRAAERLRLTQPAVSHALGRLRTLFGDPLFVRTPAGMVPTPAALNAAKDIRPALRQIGEALGRRDDFAPAASSREFTVGMSDYASAVLLPGLLEKMRREAPDTTLTVKNSTLGSGLAQLDDEAVELVVGTFPPPPQHMEERLLFKEDFVCAARSGHPEMRKRLTMKRYLSMEHLQVSTRAVSHGYVDDVLDALGAKRKIKATVGHFLVAPLLLRETDLLATEPRRLFSPLARELRLALRPPPFPIPTFRVTQVWHSRYNTDLGHAWLRGMVEKCL